MGKDIKDNATGRYAAAKFHPSHHYQVVVIHEMNDNITLNVLIDAMEPEMLWDLNTILKDKRYKK